MENKVTKKTLTYPKGYEPDYIIPKEYCEYRFILGKTIPKSSCCNMYEPPLRQGKHLVIELLIEL